MGEFEARFAALRERFVAQAGRQAVAIEQNAREGRWGEVRDICHVIAGGAGMFGFGTFGDAARELEEAIDGEAEDLELAALTRKLLDEGARLPAAN